MNLEPAGVRATPPMTPVARRRGPRGVQAEEVRRRPTRCSRAASNPPSSGCDWNSAAARLWLRWCEVTRLVIARNPAHHESNIFGRNKTFVDAKLKVLLEECPDLMRAGLAELLSAAPPERREHLLFGGSVHDDGAIEVPPAMSRSLANMASTRVSVAVCAEAYFHHRVSLYLPFRSDIELFRAYERSMGRAAKSDAPVNEGSSIRELSASMLPGVAALEPQEMLDVRAASEFGGWRADLRAALAEAAPDATLVPEENGWEPGLDAQEQLQSALDEARAKLLSGISRSPALQAVMQAGWTGFLSGVAGPFVQNLVDPQNDQQMAGLLVSAGVVIAINVAVPAAQAFDAAPRGPSKALVRHYAAGLQNRVPGA